MMVTGIRKAIESRLKKFTGICHRGHPTLLKKVRDRPCSCASSAF
jgi:hypothetical protein